MLSGRSVGRSGGLGATLVGVLQPAGDRCRVEQYLVLVTIGNAAGSEVLPYPLDLDAGAHRTGVRCWPAASCQGPRQGPRWAKNRRRKEGRPRGLRAPSLDGRTSTIAGGGGLRSAGQDLPVWCGGSTVTWTDARRASGRRWSSEVVAKHLGRPRCLSYLSARPKLAEPRLDVEHGRPVNGVVERRYRRLREAWRRR